MQLDLSAERSIRLGAPPRPVPDQESAEQEADDNRREHNQAREAQRLDDELAHPQLPRRLSHALHDDRLHGLHDDDCTTRESPGWKPRPAENPSRPRLDYCVATVRLFFSAR